MFFADAYQHFFRPLTGKYREQVVECLRLLYERLYTAKADYGESLAREQILEIFCEALTRAPQLDSDDDSSEQEPSADKEPSAHKEPSAGQYKEQRFKNLREQAGWILNSLVDYGWLEKQVDGASLRTSFPFTRRGRLFTQPLVELNSTRVRTRHRNTRNTLNALEAFAARGEVYDLIDAWEYSERIVSDFTDMIAELEERTRELVREVEAQLLVQQAAEDFFSFMESRFQPDLAIRLSADSVEKHRDAIGKVIRGIRRKERQHKAEWEKRLRQLLPELVDGENSLLWMMLNTIEERMQRACEVKLPALRRALHGFTRRADIIIRQLTFMRGQESGNLAELCQRLGESPERDRILQRLGDQLETFRLRLVDPAQVQLHQRERRKPVDTRVQEERPLEESERREIVIQQLLDQAFTQNSGQLREYLQRALGRGKQIRSSALPISNARELLAMSHILEVASVDDSSSDFALSVKATGERDKNVYFEFDEFIFELSHRD